MEILAITMGLPGSGKTTWAKQQESRDTLVVHADEKIKRFASQRYTMEEVIHNNVRNISRYNYKQVVIDGLFLTLEDVKKVVKQISESEDFKVLELHIWDEDREACLWNDKGRRKDNSEITIKTAIYEPKIGILDFESLKPSFRVKIVKHTVKRKPEWKAFADEMGISLTDNGNLVSDTWSLGGESWDYNGNKRPVYSEPQPASFKEFDSLLREISPNISFLKYKELFDECVSIEDKEDSDYYSRQQVAFFVCNLPKLFSMLNEMGEGLVIWAVVSKKDDVIVSLHQTKLGAEESHELYKADFGDKFYVDQKTVGK